MVTLGVGVAAVGTAGALLFFQSKKKEPPPPRTPRAFPSRSDLAAGAQSPLGATLVGTF